jgi:hypothetical protein
VYAAAGNWAESCLLLGGSVFGDEALWMPENVRRLNAAFVENLLTDERSFLDKLKQQLEPTSPEVKRLTAEMLWLMMLFPSNVSVEAKLRLVRTVYEWSDARLPLEHTAIHTLSTGVGSTGQAYNQHRWRELAMLIRAMSAWGELPQREQTSLVTDGWRFAAWLDRIPDAKNRQIRNILLHLLFPAQFERVSSFGQKRRIVRQFAPKFGIVLPRESVSLPVDAFDRPLAEIRRHLEEISNGRTIDFYDEDLAAQWRGTGTGDPSGPSGNPVALEKRLAPGVRDVVQGHLRLASGIPELRARPTLGLLVSAMMRSVEENRTDTALALWRQLNRPALPADANAVLLLFRLPYDRVDGWPSPSHDVDIEALLAGSAGQAVRPVLARADECAREVSGKAAPEVSIRHLVGALLRPGPDNEAKQALVQRGFSLARLRAGLTEFLQTAVPEETPDAWREYFQVAPPVPVLPRPDFARDYVDPDRKDLDPDHLEVDPDVQALARLLCAASVEPPLSVGLFADWGTGKSTFMQRLKWNIGVLSSRAESAERRGVPTAYQGGVVSIWFNAWHYMDANLWASMVTRIFDQLAQHLSGDAREDAVEQARKQLYGRLAASQDLLADAERRKSLAVADVTAARERVNAALSQQSGIASRISRARDVAAGLWTAIAGAPDPSATAPATPVGAPGAASAADAGTTPREAVDAEAAQAVDAALAELAKNVRGSVQAAARELGLDEGQASVAEIRGALAQMRGAWGNVSASAEILHRRRGIAGDLLLLLPVLLVVGAAVAAALVFDWNEVRAWAAAATGLVLSLATVASFLAASAAKVRRVLERADAEIRASTDRAAAEADGLQRELDRLKEAEAAAERDRVGAERTVGEIQSEIEDIRAGRRLQQFIRDRAGSDDYRRHLGIIATIRQDFEALQRLLDQVREESAHPPPPPPGTEPAAPARPAPAVRRIVLYIDDLDRCPEERVVEVLQAVHLLLAFPLFVVVVGVDPRWLLRAVQSQYDRLLAGEREAAHAGLPADDTVHWASTPQNYLEKIFQIPFTLEPMTDQGFGRLLGSLIKVRAPAPTALPAPTENGSAISLTTAGGGDGGEETESPGLDEQWLDDDSPEEDETDDAGADEDAGLDPPGLEVEEWELKYLSGLAPLIGSPRMAKRFANVYRFIRASLSGARLDGFSGTAEKPGEFRAAGLLLALLTGFPGEAVELFRRLLGDVPVAGEAWPAFVRRIARELAAEQRRADAAAAKKPPAGAVAAAHAHTEEGTAAGQPAPDEALPARRWSRLLAALEQVETGVVLEGKMEPYRSWAPRVARFSFQTGQILARRSASTPLAPRAGGNVRVSSDPGTHDT